jgi:NTP pyrophosphatase (non-canonical NTP hydrolase)
MTRVLEECGEVAKEVNNREGSGVKRLKNGEPSRENLAHEIRQSLTALAQLAVYYGVENELEADIEITIEKMKREGLIAE